MPEFRITPSARLEKVVDGEKTIVWKQSEVDRFNPSILGLGDLSSRSKRVEALAAVFDLEGFTNFCKQIDPHLSVPAYLNAFLNWLMAELKKETVQKKHPEGSELWHPLPFFVKFLGDGLRPLKNMV